MEHNTSNELEFLVDLEGGGTFGHEDSDNDPVLGNRQAKKVLGRTVNGNMGFDNGECSTEPCNLGNSHEISLENIQLLIGKSQDGQIGEHAPAAEKKHAKEKRKAANFKKSAKPPRPPQGSPLDAADLKFAKEISELAMKKRVRTARLKALKKMKDAKSSSSNSSLIAMVITFLFCLAIIFQGIWSRNISTVIVQGSPEPATAAAANSLISVKFYPKSGAEDDLTGPMSESPGFVERVPGSELRCRE